LADESTILEYHNLPKANNLASLVLATVTAKLIDRDLLRKGGTAVNEHDITQAQDLLHGEENVVFAGSGFCGITKHEEIQSQHREIDGQVDMIPDKR
jgi:IS5 family transposase